MSVVYSLQLRFPVGLLTLKYTQGYYKSSRVLLSMPLHFFAFATDISDGTPHVTFTFQALPMLLATAAKEAVREGPGTRLPLVWAETVVV